MGQRSEIHRKSAPGALIRIAELTDEAIILFDAKGEITFANEMAQTLLGTTEPEGQIISRLFWNREDSNYLYEVPEAPGAFSYILGTGPTLLLPFVPDGTPQMCVCGASPDRLALCSVRCDKVSGFSLYVLVFKRVSETSQLALAAYRDMGVLQKTNQRLAGTLKIILDTLDTDDVTTLFASTLEEIRRTMDADGTMVYLADKDGFHFQKSSDSLGDAHIPTFLPYGRSFEALAVSAQQSVRLHILADDGKLYKQEGIAVRRVQDEDTTSIAMMPSYLLPPFESFIAVPVWFDGHVIALIVVGWLRFHTLERQDARLLDSVAQYLSIQIMGAAKTLRLQHQEQLERLEADIHEFLVSFDEFSCSALYEELEYVAQCLDAIFVPVTYSKYFESPQIDLPRSGCVSLPVDLDNLRVTDGMQLRLSGNEVVRLISIPTYSELSLWLDAKGEACQGVFVDLGEVLGYKISFFLLREGIQDPFDEYEIASIERIAQLIVEYAQGVKAHEQDRRIAQALQQGMRNELQHVRGIEADGIYSSATADAFVGGDFYDLIRLPNNRACVIMGDVSGKGVEAASVSAAVKTALAAYAWCGLKPAAMVRTLNNFLLGFSRVETFATLFVGVVDMSEQKLTYCSAGHPPTLLYKASEQNIDTLDVQSGVVGAFKGMQYKDGEVLLSEGDMLLLYTDGVTEARSPEGGFFGDLRLRETALELAPLGIKGFLDNILLRLDRYTDNHLEDDVALVAVRFTDFASLDDTAAFTMPS